MECFLGNRFNYKLFVLRAGIGIVSQTVGCSVESRRAAAGRSCPDGPQLSFRKTPLRSPGTLLSSPFDLFKFNNALTFQESGAPLVTRRIYFCISVSMLDGRVRYVIMTLPRDHVIRARAYRVGSLQNVGQLPSVPGFASRTVDGRKGRSDCWRTAVGQRSDGGRTAVGQRSRGGRTAVGRRTVRAAAPKHSRFAVPSQSLRVNL